MVRQAEFLLGPVGVIAGGAACADCGFDLPPGARLCPVCGFERAPYPAGKVERYDWVLDQPIADPIAKLVLFALISHDKPGGEGIFPSHERLARMTGLSRRAVVNALARLRKAGWVERHKGRRRDGRQGTNRYTIRQPGMIAPGCTTCTLARVHVVHSKG